MHNCKKRVVQCLNVSFITVAQFLTDVRHVLQPKFGIQNDNLNGTDFRLPVLVRESLLFPVVESTHTADYSPIKVPEVISLQIQAISVQRYIL